MNLSTKSKLIVCGAVLFASQAYAALVVNLNAGPDLASNPAALAAFDRAAQQWENLFADDITVEINADLTDTFTNPNIIGGASSVIVCSSFNNMRDALVNDAANELDDGVVAGLANVTTGQFTLPTGYSMSGSACATRANAKALGFNVGAGVDATINFNSDFTFDFDNSDGVAANAIDFETVAAHEIAHALGFVSEVDNNNLGDTIVSPRTLDFFRFATTENPDDATEFAQNNRTLEPGVEALFDDLANEYRFSTGLNGAGLIGGDGRQASHWKDDAVTNDFIGIMDPTINFGTVVPITAADIRAFDLIGYEVNAVPEPSQVFLGSLVLAGVVVFNFYKTRAQ